MAEQLRPRLQRSGPASEVPHIMAAILIARDSMPAREACRAVDGVPNNVHGRVNRLASRVRELLDADGSTRPTTSSASRPMTAATTLSQPSAVSDLQPQESAYLDLPPLRAIPSAALAQPLFDLPLPLPLSLSVPPLQSPPPPVPAAVLEQSSHTCARRSARQLVEQAPPTVYAHPYDQRETPDSEETAAEAPQVSPLPYF